jgi:hypothetical protein
VRLFFFWPVIFPETPVARICQQGAQSRRIRAEIHETTEGSAGPRIEGMRKSETFRARWVALLLALAVAPAPADEDLWKSGLNLHIRLVEQDDSLGASTPPNEHPVVLNSQEITNALNTLEVWDKKSFMNVFRKSEGAVTVFSQSQAGTLGMYIADGLKRATPRQEIEFALARNEKGFMNIRETSFTAGRAFYAGGRLNIIIGDFAKPADRFQERAYQSSGVEEIHYFFSHGKRSKASGFDRAVVAKPGVQINEPGGKARFDWLLIDVPVASAAYIAAVDAVKGAAETAGEKAVREEAERLAAERRELRAEMARMRKEMKEMSGDGGGAPPQEDMEARLAKLNELYEKKLISKEEYESKRKALLEEI